MTLGPVMLDIGGPELDAEDRELLHHPAVGGVILFSRNYVDPEQLEALATEIHAVRRPSLIVAVDQEGGRVQRCREGFTALPPVHRIGRLYDLAPDEARSIAQSCGWLMAAELRAAQVDISFAPVLDLDKGVSEVIGDRSFHRSPEVVADLAGRYCSGMRMAGMVATGKHFPGHGSVVADSHKSLPVDSRPYADIAEDMLPFERMIPRHLEAVMPAHVVYSQLDENPAGFSKWWLKSELRKRIGFQGVIFSDDLSMEAAAIAGGPRDRAIKAMEAGCDMVLVCNDRQAAIDVVERLDGHSNPASQVRLARLHGRKAPGSSDLAKLPLWREARDLIAHLSDRPDLVLNG
ncbi:MAG: beta-N-acetylhexosaminidase [Gammaproteobacteria bacterium]